MVRGFPPPSDQPANTYCVPAGPPGSDWGDATAIVLLADTLHEGLQDIGVPATFTDNPAGYVVIVAVCGVPHCTDFGLPSNCVPVVPYLAETEWV
jgi:hypothetical protein